MPPQVNATITRVQAATAATGGRDDWDDAMGAAPAAPGEPAGAGAEKWAGAVDAFLEEKVDKTLGPDGADVYERRKLYIDAADARALGVDTDDVVTFTGPDGVQRTATAAAIAIAELAGIPRDLQTATLELRAA